MDTIELNKEVNGREKRVMEKERQDFLGLEEFLYSIPMS